MDALTAIRMNALLELAEADPADTSGILRWQAIVRVTGDLPDMITREIIASGADDGGFPA